MERLNVWIVPVGVGAFVIGLGQISPFLSFQCTWAEGSGLWSRVVRSRPSSLPFCLWNRWTEFNGFDRKQLLSVLYQVCVFGPIEKTRWPPRYLICWDIFEFPSETTEHDFTKLNWKQTQRPLPSLCFRVDQKNKMTARPLVGWDIFNFFSETAERNSMKMTWSKITSSTNYVFSDWSENQDGRPDLSVNKGGTLYSGSLILWMCI